MKIHSVRSQLRSNSFPPTSMDVETPVIQNPLDEFTALNITDSVSGPLPTDHPPPTTSETPDASDSAGDPIYVSVQNPDGVLISGSDKTLSLPHGINRRRGGNAFLSPVAHRGRLYAKRQKNAPKRLVQKSGHSKVEIKGASTKKQRYLRDFFTTIMDLKWRYHVILFFSAFLLCWFLFGLGWLAISVYSGDSKHAVDDSTLDYCVKNVYDFQTAMLFSIEIQSTIGYGFRLLGPECPSGFILMMIQTLIGVFIQSFITGIIFSKIAWPKRRAETIVFSQAAVVCIRDGYYNLIFRVGDLRKAHIIGTSIRALLVKSRKTNEGELIPLCQYPLDLITESSMTDSYMFFFWPVTVAHRITESSPLWNLSAESLLTTHFEVIVILEGTVQTSGSLIQIKTSYIPSEIRWGQRLTPLVTTLCEDGDYEIDYSNFHDTTPVSMPDYSAKEYAEKLASNTVCPVETEGPATLTSPVLFNPISKSSSRTMFRPLRLQGLFKQTKAATIPCWLRAKLTAEENNQTDHQETVADSSQAEVECHSSPPPNYPSLSLEPRPMVQHAINTNNTVIAQCYENNLAFDDNEL